MAILLQEEKSRVNWTMIIGVIVILAVILGGAYFLFFSPVPGIEVILRRDEQLTDELAKISLDPNIVLGKDEFRRLREYPGAASAPVGRSNPLIKF